MGASDTPQFTAELLHAYSMAALQNAADLLTESALLLKHEHWARAYFLAVASIEETGKALQAFHGQARNLADPAVASKLKASMESHSHKISYAFTGWILRSENAREGIQAAVELMVHLQRGREPSMYSDLRTNPDRAQLPKDVVRREAAIDCARLAGNCFIHAGQHIQEGKVPAVTRAQDQVFTMKTRQFQEMLNNADFWWYFIARMEKGHTDLAEAVLGYERNHLRPGVLFKKEEQGEQGT